MRRGKLICTKGIGSTSEADNYYNPAFFVPCTHFKNDSNMIKIDVNEQNEKMIFISGKEEKFCLKIKDITYIFGKGYMSEIHLVNGSTYSAMHLLKRIEEKLEKSKFFRTHRNVLINTEHFICIRKTHNKRVVELNGGIVEISRRKAALLKKIIWG